MEMFNLDFVSVLIFVLPGHYFIAFSGLRIKEGFPIAVNTLFFGIVLAFVMNYFYPVEKYAQLLSNPLAGAVVLSLWGIVLGFGVRLLLDPIKRIFR
jgi:hypothetical protein